MFAPKKSVPRAFSAFDKINTTDEIKDVVKNKHLGIIIGKGQAFSDEEMMNVRMYFLRVCRKAWEVSPRGAPETEERRHSWSQRSAG